MKIVSRVSWILVPALIIGASWILVFFWHATPWWSPGIDINCFRRLVCTFTAIFSFIVYVAKLVINGRERTDALEISAVATSMVAGVFVFVK